MLHQIRKKDLYNHLIFWVVMFVYYLSSNWSFYTNKLALIERYVFKTGFQILLAYFFIWVLIPYLLNKKRYILFIVSGLCVNYVVYVLYTLIRVFYLNLKYPDAFKSFDLYDRVLDFGFYFNEVSWFIFPIIALVAFRYYQQQEEVLKLREQKKVTELNLLKNQLNPHFLFNTLNNLYTLSLKKSDHAPEVILKLSKILDYMLYHCKDNFVAISDEINLLNNYIALEKVRYGKRLEITFSCDIQAEVKIAPLILLTFVENAFKHGVSQEIKAAQIQINLKASLDEIYFQIKNSKPATEKIPSIKGQHSIGLKNISKQLDILYPDLYSLEISDQKNVFVVDLKLIPHDIYLPDR